MIRLLSRDQNPGGALDSGLGSSPIIGIAAPSRTVKTQPPAEVPQKVPSEPNLQKSPRSAGSSNQPRWGSRIASRVWAGLVRGGRLQRSVGGEGSAWNTWNTTGLGAGAGPGQARRWLGAGTALRPVGSPQGGPFRTAFPRAVPPGSGCASCKGLARPARTGRQRKRFCRGTRR